jgi:hypothetical protein
MNCSLIALLSRKNSDILVTTLSQAQCLCWFAELFFYSISTTDTIYSFFALSQTLYFVYKFFLFQLFFQEINFFSDILETCRHSLSTTSCHSPTEIIPSMGCSFLSFGWFSSSLFRVFLRVFRVPLEPYLPHKPPKLLHYTISFEFFCEFFESLSSFLRVFLITHSNYLPHNI